METRQQLTCTPGLVLWDCSEGNEEERGGDTGEYRSVEGFLAVSAVLLKFVRRYALRWTAMATYRRTTYTAAISARSGIT